MRIIRQLNGNHDGRRALLMARHAMLHLFILFPCARGAFRVLRLMVDIRAGEEDIWGTLMGI